MLLYALTWQFGWNLPAYPTGTGSSIRSPGSCCSCSAPGARSAARSGLVPVLRSPITLWVAIAYLVFAFLVTLTWHIPQLAFLMPRWLSEWMYPIDKVNLDVLRFAAFPGAGGGDGAFRSARLAAAAIAWLRPAILCGQHSLEIFCLGVFLAFAAHFVMGEFYGGVLMQVAVSVIGIAHHDCGGVAALVVQGDRRSRGVPKRTADMPIWREAMA